MKLIEHKNFAEFHMIKNRMEVSDWRMCMRPEPGLGFVRPRPEAVVGTANGKWVPALYSWPSRPSFLIIL